MLEQWIKLVKNMYYKDGIDRAIVKLNDCDCIEIYEVKNLNNIIGSYSILYRTNKK